MGGQVKTRALVIGSAPQYDWKNLWRYPVRDAYLIAADGGRRAAEKMGLSVDWYVGDGDSGGSGEGVPGTVLPGEKDLTDLEAGVQCALKKGLRTILLWGVSGGRMDHHLANLQMLEQVARSGSTGIFLDPVNEVRFLSPGQYEISNDPAYRYLGIIPLDACMTDVSIRGVKYPLSHATVERGYTRTVSNEILPGETARLSIGTGAALLVRSDPVFPCQRKRSNLPI